MQRDCNGNGTQLQRVWDAAATRSLACARATRADARRRPHPHPLNSKENTHIVYVHLQLAADNARAESGGMNQ